MLITEVRGSRLTLTGELDAFSCASVRHVLDRMQLDGGLIVDLGGVAFIDSAGLGALVGAVRRAGGDVVVASPRASVTAVLEGTGFDRLATIVRTVAEAEVVLTTGPRLVKAG